MNNNYQADAVESIPELSTLTSRGYPTNGSPELGIPATQPGAAWFYSVNEEIRNAIDDAGITPDKTKVNQLSLAIQKSVNTRLSLEGGQLSAGANVSVNTDNSSLTINGATDSTKGASIVLTGKDATSNAGEVNITASNGTDTANLKLAPDSTLKLGDKNVVLSVNNTFADITGNVTIATGSSNKAGSIGTPGELGFGVGIYPGTDEELTAMGLTHMFGYDNVTSDNYGNYMHATGGQMIFVPAFYVRYGSQLAPQYATYDVNSLEVAEITAYESEEVANAEGFYLHRAFIDGNEKKSGFFVSKYHMTVTTTKSITYPVSGPTTPTASVTPVQMIDYCRSLGSGWNCPSAFIMSAIDILSMCHAQFAKWTNTCKWFDPSGTTSYPEQGRNVTTNVGLYSHNGQPCGLMGFEYYWEYVLGCTTAGSSATQGQTAVTSNDLYVLKKSAKLGDITSGFGGDTDAWGTTSSLLGSHEVITADYPISTNRITYWGNSSYPVFTDNSTENGNALFGILPRDTNAIGNGANFIAKSLVYNSPCTQNLALHVHGQSVVSRSYDENPFAREFRKWRVDSGATDGFRGAGYAL